MMLVLLTDTSNFRGRVGVIVPPGIATSDTYKLFFQDVVRKQQLVSFYEFVNREGLFRAIEVNVKFALLILSCIPQNQMLFAAQLWNTGQLNIQSAFMRLVCLTSKESIQIHLIAQLFVPAEILQS